MSPKKIFGSSSIRLGRSLYEDFEGFNEKMQIVLAGKENPFLHNNPTPGSDSKWYDTFL